MGNKVASIALPVIGFMAGLFGGGKGGSPTHVRKSKTAEKMNETGEKFQREIEDRCAPRS